MPYWLHLFVIGAGLRWLLDDGRRNRLSWKLEGAGARAAGWLTLATALVLPPALRAKLGWNIYPIHLDPVPMTFVVAILWLGAAQAGPFKLFAAKVPRWFGRISYGIYLIHIPIITLAVKLAPSSQKFLQFALVVALSICGAALSHRLFEQPIRTHLLKRFSRI